MSNELEKQEKIVQEIAEQIPYDLLEGGAILTSTLFPAYNLANKKDKIEKSEKEQSVQLLNSFTLYKIAECKIYEVEDKFTYFIEKLQGLFTAAYSAKKEICYGFISKNNSVSLVVGVDPTSENKEMQTFISGFLPGMKLEKYESKFSYDIEKEKFVGTISGVPIFDRDKNLKEKDFSNLIRSLYGQDYTVMVMAKPVDNQEISQKIQDISSSYNKISQLVEKSKTLQEGTSESTTKGETISKVTKSTSKKVFDFADTLAPYLTLIPKVGPTIGVVYDVAAGGYKALYSNSTVSKNNSETTSTNTSMSITSKDVNILAKRFAELLEKSLNRLEIGKNIGMWESVISYSSNSELASKMIEGTLYNNLSSTSMDTLSPISINYKDRKQELMIPKGFFSKEARNTEFNWASFVTSDELALSSPIPVSNTVGFQYQETKPYPINYFSSEDEVKLGLVCEYDAPLENLPFGLSEYDLNKHTFVTGITGCGKTNTVKNILENVNKPFMVIEPAKTEYRNINKNVTVYTLGRPAVNSLQLNPFYVPMGVSPQHHIDLLKELFNASFALYGPMPYILEKCLNNIYLKKGWNLTLGLHPHSIKTRNSYNLFDRENMESFYTESSHRYLFPTMQDLKDEIDYYIENEMTYDGEIKGNIKSAIKARIDSLCVGAKGFMFNNHNVPDFKNLLEKNTVLELEGLADDSDKAFALGLLIIYINEYRQANKQLDSSSGLKHLLVIEEAHRLLRNVSLENGQDVGNPKGKAVEHFTNILAEMRSYGQGVIVAEQIPTKLTPDVIKNSSNKIIHRLVAKDDQEIIASTIGLRSQDAIHIGNQKVGHALCHKEGMSEPVLVKFNRRTEENIVLDYKLYKSDINNTLFELNKNEIKSYLSKEIDVYALRVLTTLLYKPESDSINNGLEKIYTIFSGLIRKNDIPLSPMNEKIDKVILECIIESITCNLVSGMLAYSKLPEESLLTQIRKVLEFARENDVKLLVEYFEKFYSRKTDNKIIEFIANVVFDVYSKNINLEPYIAEFILENSKQLAKDVKVYLDNKYKEIYDRSKD